MPKYFYKNGQLYVTNRAPNKWVRTTRYWANYEYRRLTTQRLIIPSSYVKHTHHEVKDEEFHLSTKKAWRAHKKFHKDKNNFKDWSYTIRRSKRDGCYDYHKRAHRRRVKRELRCGDWDNLNYYSDKKTMVDYYGL